MLRHVEEERLAERPRGRRGLVEPVARGVVVADRDGGRDEPGERVAGELEVVQRACDGDRLEQHLVHLLVRPRPP